MFNLYLRTQCFSLEGEKELLGSYITIKEAHKAMYNHYNKESHYTRIICAAPNEFLYDVGSHVHFYSIENTEGDMPL